MNIQWRALLRGAFVGLSIIIPISILVELLDRNVDDLEGSAWMVLPFIAVLAAYVVCGRIAGGLAPDTPLSHGALAALISFGGWLLVRVTIPLVLGNDLGFRRPRHRHERDVRDGLRVARRRAQHARRAASERHTSTSAHNMRPPEMSVIPVADAIASRIWSRSGEAFPASESPSLTSMRVSVGIEGHHEEEQRSGAALDGLGDQLADHVLDRVDVRRRAARIDHLGADLLAGTPHRGNLTRERATQRFHGARLPYPGCARRRRLRRLIGVVEQHSATPAISRTRRTMPVAPCTTSVRPSASAAEYACSRPRRHADSRYRSSWTSTTIAGASVARTSAIEGVEVGAATRDRLRRAAPRSRRRRPARWIRRTRLCTSLRSTQSPLGRPCDPSPSGFGRYAGPARCATTEPGKCRARRRVRRWGRW